MSEIVYTKKCEKCGSPIPDDFQNLLCLMCYDAAVLENELRHKEAEEVKRQEMLKDKNSPTNPSNLTVPEPVVGKTDAVVNVSGPAVQETQPPSAFGITDPNYRENPEMDDKDQILANLAQFIYTHDASKGKKGKLLWYPQRNMYTFIKNECIKKVQAHSQYAKQIWKPFIVDVGCGSGVGSNLLSQEADFVWGIDKNEWSIEFAKEAFTREKNGIYYTPQVTFDVFDIMVDTRQCVPFDIVVAIEVIEHIFDSHKFLNSIKRFARRDKKGDVHVSNCTEYYISSPNRNSPKIRKDKPDNLFHVREWTSQEYKALLLQHFEQVTLMNNKGEGVTDDARDDIILAKCVYPK